MAVIRNICPPDKYKLISCLLLTLFIFIITVLPAGAEDYAVAQTYIHAFSNDIAVYTGVFALNREVSLNTTAYFKYTVDMINPNFFEGEGGEEGGLEADKKVVSKGLAAISGASTAAGSNAASDIRNNLTLGLTHNFDDVISVEAGYDYSSEKDYISGTPGITLKKELFRKNTTLILGYSKNMDTVDGKYMISAENKNTNNYYAGLTQIITAKTIAQIGYSRNEVTGFMPEGNRLVPVNGATAVSCTDKSATCLLEVFPDGRRREAYILGINHYLQHGLLYPPAASSVRLTLRYYKDDWDVSSYTEEAEYYQYLPSQNLLRLDIRTYQQSKAFFVKSSYLSTDTYLTVSPQLEKQNTYLLGIKFSHAFEDDPDYGIFANSHLEGGYEFYTQSTSVSAHNFSIGVKFLF